MNFFVSLTHLEEDLEVFPESGAVVIPDCLGVAEALEEGRGLQDLLSDQVGGGLVDRGQVLHDQLGAENGKYTLKQDKVIELIARYGLLSQEQIMTVIANTAHLSVLPAPDSPLMTMH